MTAGKAVAATLVTIVLVCAIVLGGWAAGWWFRTQNINRESHLFRNGYSNQQTLRDQITQKMSDVLSITPQIAQTKDPQEKSALAAQRKAVVAIICQDASQITGDPLQGEQQAFVSTNCQAGAVSPSSRYSEGVNP